MKTKYGWKFAIWWDLCILDGIWMDGLCVYVAFLFRVIWVVLHRWFMYSYGRDSFLV